MHWSTRFATLVVFLAAYVHCNSTEEVPETLQTFTDPRSTIDVCIQREASSRASLDIDLEVQSLGSKQVFPAGSAIITRKLLKARRIQELHVEHTFLNDTVHGLYITLDREEIEFQPRIDRQIWKTAYKFHQLIFHVQGKIKNVTCVSENTINTTSKVDTSTSIPVQKNEVSKVSTVANTESGISPTATTFLEELSSARTALSDQYSTLTPNYLEWLWILGEIYGIPVVLLIILGSMTAAILIGSIICCCCCECKKKKNGYDIAKENEIIGNIIHSTIEENQCFLNNAPQIREHSLRPQIHPEGYHSLQLLHGNKRAYINSSQMNILPNDNNKHTPVSRKFSVPINNPSKFSPKLPPNKRFGEATEEFKYFDSKSNNSSVIHLNNSKPDLLHDYNRDSPVNKGSPVSRSSAKVDYRNSSPHSIRTGVNSSPHTVMMDPPSSNQYCFQNNSPNSFRRSYTSPQLPEAVYDEPYDCVNSKRMSSSGMSTFKRNSNNNH